MPTTASPSRTGTAPIRFCASRSTTARTASFGRAEITAPVRSRRIAPIVIAAAPIFGSVARQAYHDSPLGRNVSPAAMAIGRGGGLVHGAAHGQTLPARQPRHIARRLGALSPADEGHGAGVALRRSR